MLGVRGSSLDSIFHRLSPIPFNNMPNQAKKLKQKKIILFTPNRQYGRGFPDVGLNDSVLAYPACLSAVMALSYDKQA